MKARWMMMLVAACMVLSMLAGCGGNAENNVDETKKPVGQETTADSGLNWKDQYDLGIRLLNEGRYEDAILAFTAAIQINPKSVQAYVSRANAYLSWADAAIQDAYASLGEGETLVWSDITVSTSEGDKTIGDLFQNAADDFAKADDLIANGESTDELDADAAKDAADKQAEALANLAQSLLPKKDEPGVLDQILELLDKADALTDEEEIQKMIDAIRGAATAPTEARRPLGYRMEYENPEDGTPTGWTKFYYDDNGRKIGEAYVEADGTEQSMTPIYYDANGHQFPDLWTSYEYVETDANGWITAMGYSSSQISKRFAYDDNGNLIEYLDGEYYRYEYVYDEANLLLRRDFYNAFGLDDMTLFMYDSQGRLIQKQSYAYYSSGNSVPTYINYQYDDAGRLVYQETLDNDGNPYIWTSYTYKSIGELISEYHWYEPNPEFGGPYSYIYIYE
ncbi:MAG: hypothetical protein IKT45_03460 [Lachnospiraceae bacterium]|nr:hypothetical protein [Lachnospiraceae bacterium]